MSFGDQQSFHVLTRKVREAFLNPERARTTLTLDLAKEEFFRTEVPFGSIIYNEARKNDLPPELVAAMVESESDFQPRLVSNKNAQGLMQIVPETGRLMGCDDLFNPRANVAAGTKYFRYLLDRFGDERIALAAYNAGEGAVERFGGVPEYRETIDYVHRVASRTGLYRKRVQQRYNVAVQMQASVVAR
jgi:soluble lytic murein transglycosylase-like protein